jgi:hypothetical protein
MASAIGRVHCSRALVGAAELTHKEGVEQAGCFVLGAG